MPPDFAISLRQLAFMPAITLTPIDIGHYYAAATLSAAILLIIAVSTPLADIRYAMIIDMMSFHCCFQPLMLRYWPPYPLRHLARYRR
jgi:hypothetical protein